MEIYHLALDKFIGYSLTPEGINSYLNSLTCGNAKHNYFRCIKTLCLIILVAIFVYALRHPDIDDWRGH